MGLPVIATNIGGPRDIIKDNYNGILVPPRDVKTLADKIKLIAQDSELRDRIKNNASENILDYEWKLVAAKYSEFFHKLLT